MISPNETVVVISFNIIIGESSGMINICIPHVVLEPIVPNLSVRYWMQTNKKEPTVEQTVVLERRLKQAPLSVIAELGNAEMTIEDFLYLQVGDVVKLNRKIDDPLVIKIGDKPKFTAQPGHLKNQMAVQIIDTKIGGDEDDE